MRVTTNAWMKHRTSAEVHCHRPIHSRSASIVTSNSSFQLPHLDRLLMRAPSKVRGSGVKSDTSTWRGSSPMVQSCLALHEPGPARPGPAWPVPDIINPINKPHRHLSRREGTLSPGLLRRPLSPLIRARVFSIFDRFHCVVR